MRELFQKLSAPFPPAKVSWRVGSVNKEKLRGMALAYIDARDVMERLDAVMLPQNWQNDYPHANGKTVCRIGINVSAGLGVSRLTNETNPTTYIETIEKWVWKADGAGDSDVEAEKGALSDAFKRAAVRWGIGRYLYDLPSPWVEVEPFGKSFRIADKEYPKLRQLLRGAELLPMARQKASVGVDTYKDWYLALPISDRESLSEYHTDLKSAAIAASTPTEKAA